VVDRSFHARHPFTIPLRSLLRAYRGPGQAQNEPKITKTVSNRRKISYIWGLPPLVPAERIP
jgi:hypothetical protein